LLVEILLPSMRVDSHRLLLLVVLVLVPVLVLVLLLVLLLLLVLVLVLLLLVLLLLLLLMLLELVVGEGNLDLLVLPGQKGIWRQNHGLLMLVEVYIGDALLRLRVDVRLRQQVTGMHALLVVMLLLVPCAL
jgi:hypothetical protein